MFLSFFLFQYSNRIFFTATTQIPSSPSSNEPFSIFFFSVKHFVFNDDGTNVVCWFRLWKSPKKSMNHRKKVWKSQWFTGVATRLAVSIASTAMHHVSDSSWLPLEPFLGSNGNMLQQWMGPVASWRDPAFTNLQPCYSQNTKLSTGCLFWKNSLLAKWAKCPSFWNTCS